jgi:hypothetical protein
MQKKSAVIITDNFSGFIVAHALNSQGFDVTLVDTDNQPRAADRFQRLGVPFYRDTSQFRHGLRMISESLTHFDPSFSGLELSQIELAPQTFMDHEWHPFVGFGDSKSSALHSLTHFNHSTSVRLPLNESEIVSKLLSQIQFKWISFAEVTGLHFAQNRLEKVTINGSQELAADLFVLMTAPREWLPLLPAEVLGSRTRARLSKGHYFARISLELTHPTAISTDENIVILTPNQVDHNPCAGRFFMQSSDNGPQYKSTWETYIPSELVEDSEFVANELKGIRKLVRRAYPSIDEKPTEVITINPFAHSDLQWTYEQQDLREIASNLLILPALGANSLGFMQCVESASWALDGVGSLISTQSTPDAEAPQPTLLS